mmetsp:Transcript_16131/g.26100  ORF Transcript_16131/g.26100 Transcript_16131/m.26100 type:complete len:236 (+) Transcript_16131:96-803(+)
MPLSLSYPDILPPLGLAVVLHPGKCHIQYANCNVGSCRDQPLLQRVALLVHDSLGIETAIVAEIVRDGDLDGSSFSSFRGWRGGVGDFWRGNGHGARGRFAGDNWRWGGGILGCHRGRFGRGDGRCGGGSGRGREGGRLGRRRYDGGGRSWRECGNGTKYGILRYFIEQHAIINAALNPHQHRPPNLRLVVSLLELEIHRRSNPHAVDVRLTLNILHSSDNDWIRRRVIHKGTFL